MLNLQLWNTTRKEKKLTLADLSQETGIALSTIKEIFRGATTDPRLETVQRIERALGLAPTWNEEEKALGVGKTAVVLSDQDEYRLTLLARADEVLGEDYTKAYLYALEIAIQQNLSK